MAFSSDDESDLSLIPDSVTNYQFVNGEDGPISFSDLPQEGLPRSEEDSMDSRVYLHGTTEDGLQKVYQPVIAWKLELDRTSPETFVKSKDGKWIKLLKPRKIYEGIIRSILISVQMLHFVKWNLNALERSLWDHLRRVFDKFERRPSEDDLWPHLSFIKDFSQHHEDLKRSRLLKDLLERKCRRRTGEGNCSVPEVKEPFIAADDEEVPVVDKGNESDEDESDLFDSVCCICDNGGELLCCEGECMRSFHATKEAGVESDCKSLGMCSLQVEAIQNFHCKNCQVKQHQCFACGKLGNSDKTKGVPEVFQCSNATCGYFYHPNCVAKLLCPDDESLALECEKTVLDGKFACPSHRCHICKKLEVKNDYDLQFATCRRCPRSYHRKCMPWKIALENDATARGITTRAWEDLLPNRILIYCLKHKIEENLGTPIRNHIKFPSPLENKEKGSVSDQNNKPKPNFEKTKGPIKKRPLENKERVRSPSPVRSPKEQQNKRFKKGEGSSNEAVRSPRQVAASDSPKPSVRKIVKSSFPAITTEAEEKVKEIYQKTSSSVTMEDVFKKRTIPLTHQNTGRQIERVARGKIEGSVEAIQTAYQRICEGKSVDDAKTVCEPEVVKQVAKWNRRLGVYLSPFLHGMRYTSFGRHFTKEEKLEEIVSKLQWYVQTDDTIVDFCCGSNDFNRLMKQKMNTIGKDCNFKSYDIMWPKDDFCFEKRDWMTVQHKELPSGSSLIMGLNPPFGTKAALANKFIDKALTFKPKLLILIVPKETERLDKKRLGGTRYELIWEDNLTLSGKSFYLPGSVDESDNQMDQWNVSPPVLSLWSRSDWGARHNAIAEEHGHFSSPQNGILGGQNDALSKEEIERGEKEAEDIISQVVGDIVEENEGVVEGLECEYENAEVLSENGNNDNDVLLKGKEKVEAVGEWKEGIVKEKTEGDNEKEERESVVERERGRRPGKGISTSTAMRQAKLKKKSKESRPSEAIVVDTGLEEERETDEGERRLDEERERESGGDEGERELAEGREREEGEKKLSEEREREERLFEEREREKRLFEEREREKRLSEERERERRLSEEREREKRLSEEREREKKRLCEERENEKRLSEEREREKRLSEEREREKRLSEEREKEKTRLSEEREREKKRLFEERENEKRLSEEREREKRLSEREREKRLSEEREKEKTRLSVESERDMEAKKRRLREWNEKSAKRRAEEREREKRLAEERERERLADEERERQRLADEERERLRLAEEEEREKRLAEEREREYNGRRPPFNSRERDSGPHFNRRSPIDSRERNSIRRSPSDPRERNRFRRSPSDPRERNSIRRSPSDPRERNHNQSDYLGPHRNMEISPQKNTSNNNNNNNNKPLMEEPIETRHLSSQDDFSGLDDIEVIAKRYTSGPAPSFTWNSTIGSGPGFRSGPDYIHYSMDNNTNNNNNNRDFDNFDDTFGRPFNGYNNNNTSSSYLYNNTSSSYLSSLGGTGTGTGSSALDLYAPRLDDNNFAGTSGSAIDRYAPRLDETNFTRPGPPAQAQFGNFGYGALSGPHMAHYDNVGVLRRDMPPPPQSDQFGFRARDPYLFGRAPPGSSGGWLDD